MGLFDRRPLPSPPPPPRNQLRCGRPATDVIKTWNSPDTLHYCDPPYLPTTRNESSREVYGVEMSEDGHCELTDVLKSCTGKVILSGYPSELYSDL